MPSSGQSVAAADDGRRFEIKARRVTNKAVALGVLGVMGFMAVGGLVLALMTQKTRRDRDRAAPEAATVRQPVPLTAPSALAGLAYLPADAELVAGIQVAAALEEGTGRDLLGKVRLGDLGLADLEKWTGLKREEIDHVVIGLRTGEQHGPGWVAVIDTHQLIDVAGLRERLQARPHRDPGGKALYTVRLAKPALEAVLWCPTDRILVVGRTARDLEALPLQAEAGVNRLPLAVQRILKERVDSTATAWVAGHVEHWDALGMKRSAGLLAMLPAEDRATLSRVRTFAVSLELEPQLTVRADLQCSDDAGARAVARLLERGQKQARDLVVHQKDEWVNAQLRLGGAEIHAGMAGGQHDK